MGETYYGDSAVVPTDQKYFTFTINEDGKTATITGVKDEYAVKTYYHDNGTDVYNCAIIDNGTYITDIVIPYEYVEGENSYTVSDIGKLAFGPKGTYGHRWVWWDGGEPYEAENMFTSFVLPNTITNIGESAFAYCLKMESIKLPNSIKKINLAAFDGCESLRNINITESVTSIDGYAFKVCISLSRVSLPNVTSIEERTFEECTSLSSIEIPESVTSIGDYAFSSCTSLSSINIPNSVKSIGESAFNGCTSLSSINIPTSVTSIGNYAFGGTNLTTVTIDSSTIASGLTTKTACGYVINNATTVYIKLGITPGSYITDIANFTEVASDKDGYVMYTKN